MKNGNQKHVGAAFAIGFAALVLALPAMADQRNPDREPGGKYNSPILFCEPWERGAAGGGAIEEIVKRFRGGFLELAFTGDVRCMRIPTR
jgi:hypothetical protein